MDYSLVRKAEEDGDLLLSDVQSSYLTLGSKGVTLRVPQAWVLRPSKRGVLGAYKKKAYKKKKMNNKMTGDTI